MIRSATAYLIILHALPPNVKYDIHLILRHPGVCYNTLSEGGIHMVADRIRDLRKKVLAGHFTKLAGINCFIPHPLAVYIGPWVPIRAGAAAA